MVYVEEQSQTVRLIKRLHRSLDAHGAECLLTTYLCQTCGLECVRDAMLAHMTEVHGCSISIPAEEPGQQSDSAVQSPRHQGDARFSVGDSVQAKYTDGFWYAATVAALGNSQYAIHWEDGDCSDRFKSHEQLRRPQTAPPPASEAPVHITRREMPDGSHELMCPECGFACEDRLETLFAHVAAEHGQAWCNSAAGVGGDSEQLDLLRGQGTMGHHPRRLEALQAVHCVSLGCFCAVKSSIQELGLGEAHLPFDWIRSRVQGIQHFIENDFRDFFSVATNHETSGSQRVLRSERHSFWHDDVRKAEVRAKLRRRIQRFWALAEDSKNLLFLLSLPCTDDLQQIPALLTTLQMRFASTERRVFLAVIVDNQTEIRGPVSVSGLPGLVFFSQGGAAGVEHWPGAYCKAIGAAVDLVLDLPSKSASAESIDAALPNLVWDDSGLHGKLGDDPDFPAFEAPGVAHVDLSACDNP